MHHLVSLCIIIGPQATEMEVFAAQELRSYAERIFGARVEIAAKPVPADFYVLLGGAGSNPAVAKVCEGAPFPELSDQGFVLRSVEFEGKPALIAGGKTPRATLWAAYALAEEWGVRFLLHGDVLPAWRPFEAPQLDRVEEPLMPAREWRMINAPYEGPEAWGLERCETILGQLAKLRFTHIVMTAYAWHPFVHVEVRGVERSSAWMAFDMHYPIAADMPARWLFGDVKEFGNPEFTPDAPYEQLLGEGQRYCRALMAQAKRKGLESLFMVSLLDYPPEFAAALSSAQDIHQFGRKTAVPTADTDLDDPALLETAAAFLKANIDTYPEVERFCITAPEFRQWKDRGRVAYDKLDERYGIREIISYDQLIADAAKRTTYPGGAERAKDELNGDLVGLYFYSRVINDTDAIASSKRPDIKMGYWCICQELFPIVARVSPPDVELMALIDYTPTRITKHLDDFERLPAEELRAVLIATLEDDNIGLLPQLTTHSLHACIRKAQECGWAGFTTRYWQIADQDPCVAYLAEAAWNTDTTPESVYRDQALAACGPEAVDDLLALWAEVEAATQIFEVHHLGVMFPVPYLFEAHYKPWGLPDTLQKVHGHYRKALDLARQARAKASGRSPEYAAHWEYRLESAVLLMDALVEIKRAAILEEKGSLAEACDAARGALPIVASAMEAYAKSALQRSNEGAVAYLGAHYYAKLQAKVEELEEKANHAK